MVDKVHSFPVSMDIQTYDATNIRTILLPLQLLVQYHRVVVVYYLYSFEHPFSLSIHIYIY